VQERGTFGFVEQALPLAEANQLLEPR
jgi:hypothetical protein